MEDENTYINPFHQTYDEMLKFIMKEYDFEPLDEQSILDTKRYYRLTGLKTSNKYSNDDIFDLIINQIKYLHTEPDYKMREAMIRGNPFDIDLYTNETMIIDYRLNADRKNEIEKKIDNGETIITEDDVNLDVFKFVIDLDVKSEYIFDYDYTINNIGMMYEEIIRFLNNYFENKICKKENDLFTVIDDKYKNYCSQYGTFDYLHYVYSIKYFDIDNINATNVHLIYPYLFVNKIQYHMIIDELVNHMKSLEGVFENIKWEKVIDYAMCANGLRLLYVNKPLKIKLYDKKNGLRFIYAKKGIEEFKPNYYIVDKNRSSIKVNDDIKHQLIITSMSCNLSKPNIMINYCITEKEQKKEKVKEKIIKEKITRELNEKRKKKIKITEIIKKDIGNEIRKLFELLPSDYYKSYEVWFRFVCMCKTYGWYDFCIDFSENYCEGFDDNSRYIIDNVFYSDEVEKPIRINTLFHWLIKNKHIRININNLTEMIKDFNYEKFKKELFEINENNFIKELTIDMLIKTNYDDINNKIIINKQYIDNDDINELLKYNNIFLNSPLGTGKTTTFIKILRKLNNNYLNKLKNKYPRINELDIDEAKNIKTLIKYNYDEKTINDNIYNFIKNRDEEEIYDFVGIEYFNLRILVISSLISLGNKLCCDLTEFNIYNYTNDSRLINNYSNVMISLDQLYKIEDNYDIIVIDEFSSMISRMCSKTNTDKNKNFKKLIELCKNSKHIILADALLKDDSYEFSKMLFELNMKKYVYLINTYKHTNKNIININYNNINLNEESNDNVILYEFVNKILIDKINKRDSIIIACDSVKIVKKLVSLINSIVKDDELLFNNVLNDTYIKMLTKTVYDTNFVNNCNETFKNKCVIFSPKITYGIDIQIPYDEVYAVYNGNSIGSYLMLQQLGRCRKCDNIKVLILYNEKQHHIITFEKYYEFRMYLFKQNLNKSQQQKINDLITEFPLFDIVLNTNNSININEEYKYINIIIKTFYLDKITSLNKTISLKLLCEYQGYQYNTTNINITNNIVKKINTIKETTNNKLNDNIKYMKLRDAYTYFKDNKYDNEVKIIENINTDTSRYHFDNSKDLFKDIKLRIENINNRNSLDAAVLTKQQNIIDISYCIISKYIDAFINDNIDNNKITTIIKNFSICDNYVRKPNKIDKIMNFIDNNKIIITLFLKLLQSKTNITSFTDLKNKASLKVCKNDINIGGYYFNCFILMCYKKINPLFVLSIKNSIRYKPLNNDNSKECRINNKLIFNEEYIKQLNNIINFNNLFKK